MSTRTVALSTLPMESREALLFSIASEVDPNSLHFSLLPQADDANRDPNLPVVAVTWRVSRNHPVLAKIGGTDVPSASSFAAAAPAARDEHPPSGAFGGTARVGRSAYLNPGGNDDSINNHVIAAVMMSQRTPRAGNRANTTRTATPPRNNLQAQQRRPSPLQRSASSSDQQQQQSGVGGMVIEQILTVSPVIRGSPTAFRGPQYPFASRSSPASRGSGSRGRNGSANRRRESPGGGGGSAASGRSAQWAQRHVEDFLHFAAKSGVDTVQHNSVAFALQCYLQYQSGVASAIRQEFVDLANCVEQFWHVCPASRLLHWLLRECDDFSGVAALSFLASVRFNDQVIAPRQVAALTSRVETLAGHLMLINRKYLRLNETVAVLRMATRRWGMHASAHAKRAVLSFLRSHRDPENAAAFDYRGHVDLYAFLLQLGRCYVETNAGRGHPAGAVPPPDFGVETMQQQQQQQHRYDDGGDIGAGYEEAHHPDGFSPRRQQQLHQQQQQQRFRDPFETSSVAAAAVPLSQQRTVAATAAQAAAAASVDVSNITHTSPEDKTSAAAAAESPAVAQAADLDYTDAASHHQQRSGQHRRSASGGGSAAAVDSYTQQFEQRKQQQQQPRIDPYYPPRSPAWAQRINSAQHTLEEVMRRFDGPLSQRAEPSPRRVNNTNSSNVGIAAAAGERQAHRRGIQQEEQRRFVAAADASVLATAASGAPSPARASPPRPSTGVVPTVIIRDSSRERQQSLPVRGASLGSTAAGTPPRARSGQPPHPMFAAVAQPGDDADADASLDEDSAALAEQVRRALEARAASAGRSGSVAAVDPVAARRAGSEPSSLEMLAAAAY